ncbi:MAG: 30S ribosomal protein S5 [Gammaproteobacteria bacterium RIFOXYB2_FULL_38_6]|nr:MAG: 30S ribosomal protein S5 [Gammaproteobacteria bacterium RIFOXYB2_FULL_38_6]
MKSTEEQNAKDLYQEKLVSVRRTAKVVKGGRQFAFSALIVSGDGAGKIGYGLGKAREVPDAITKATEAARRNMSYIELKDKTLQHEVIARHGSAKIMMMPASTGTGIIAGNAMRAIFEVMGVENVLAKCTGSTNPVNVVQATLKGLKEMSTPEKVAKKRGKTVEEIMG